VSEKIDGRIVSACVVQVPCGEYYVSVCCTEFEPRQFPKTGASVGIQMGVRFLAVTSDGQKIDNHRFYERSRKKIARLGRAVSRKTNDSANREKARLRLAKAYKRLVNRKTDALQKATTQIVRNYDTICVRDVNHAEIMKNKLYAKYLSDAGWGAFVSLLEYKCGWYGKTLVKIDKFQSVTRICSVCGEDVADVRKKSKWNCPKCGATHERAYNAAKNILKVGLLATA
jgi:putative transposase